jgi:hypothetical protein
MANTLTLLAAPTSDKLSALRDVDAQTPAVNDYLMFNGTRWVPSSAITTMQSQIDDLLARVTALENPT